MAQITDLATWSGMLLTGWGQVDHTTFWVSLLKIISINILLSGDNAVVIAMACRGLPHRQRRPGMILGAGVAVLLLIVFANVVASLMLMPYLKVVGGLALFYIATKLLVPEERDEAEAEAVENLWRAVRIIAIADVIMSLDNVLAIAAVAQDNMALLTLGLAISIPLIIGGAALIMALLDRLPVLVWAGAALLGSVAGQVIASDRAIEGYLVAHFSAEGIHSIKLFAALLGAVLVLVAGGLWRRARQSVAAEPATADLASSECASD
jgi:YjbE family integral membrane protein